ncbi:MAG: LacI family DNA-binding transcriptional regulator, partial [Victivallales bacterium]|nr:LacI family DNA-binding transcriptional regulator [Victivallales bacterium]
MPVHYNMRDIAEKLSLSRSTISSVLNDKWREKSISQGTATRVLEYVEEIGYTPNLISLTLKGKVCKDLAIILPLNCLQRQKKVFFDIVSILQRDGVKFMILPYAKDNFNEIAQSISAYRIPRVVILAGSLKFTEYEEFLNLATKNKSVDYFLYDFRKELLFNDEKDLPPLPNNVSGVGLSYNDYHKIVLSFIAESGYKDLITTPYILEESELISHINQLGLDVSHGFSFNYPSDPETSLIEKGEEIAEHLLNLDIEKFPVITYIADDLMTVGAMNYLTKRNRKIPEQFAFISWDGLYESEFFSVPITTLSMPHDKMIRKLKSWLTKNSAKNTLDYVKPIIRKGKSM